MANGNSLVHCYPDLRAEGGREQMTGALLMAFCGYFALERGGKICPGSMAATPLATDASRSGKA